MFSRLKVQFKIFRLNRINWLLLLIILGGFLLRLYRLNSLPAEFWGDTIEHYQFVLTLKHGHWYFNFWGGDGPFFTYIAYIVSSIIGLSFFSLKLTTVLIGTALIAAIYFFAQAVTRNKYISYIASFLVAVSFWPLTFSRQAKPHILVPLFVSLVIYSYLRNKKIASGILLGIGMYTQVAFWGLPLVFLRRFKSLIAFLVVCSPVLYLFFVDPNQKIISSSFYTQKLGEEAHLSLFEIFHRLLVNLGKNMISFNFIGDSGFRAAIPNHAYLDICSGLFFILGWIIMLYQIFFKKNYSLLQWVIIPFFLLQIPSLLDIGNSLSVPNMGRTIGLIPFVYLIIAIAIYEVGLIIPGKLRLVYFIIIFGCITFINFHNYFYVYPRTLPNNNTPFGKIIAEYIDQQPLSKHIYKIGCCWGDWGQPEPKSIDYNVQSKRQLIALSASELNSCVDIKNKIPRNSILIIDPREQQLINTLVLCSPSSSLTSLNGNGFTVAKIIKE